MSAVLVRILLFRVSLKFQLTNIRRSVVVVVVVFGPLASEGVSPGT